jgi:hypothetical protein
MSTRFRCSLPAGCAAAVLSGCALTQMLGGLGGGGAKSIKAEFRLTHNPLLILLDDDAERIYWPPARRYFLDELAQELLRTQSAARIIPPETVEQLRQTHADFDRRGCREVGEMAGAEQVLWLRVQDFFVEEEFTDAEQAAFVQVTVKVINVLEKENRLRVRLWPTDRDGAWVTAALHGSDVARLKTKDAISMELAKRLAVTVARFFHDHKTTDRPPSA